MARGKSSSQESASAERRAQSTYSTHSIQRRDAAAPASRPQPPTINDQQKQKAPPLCARAMTPKILTTEIGTHSLVSKNKGGEQRGSVGSPPQHTKHLTQLQGGR
eukprot:scaffold35467_cov101-Isochrysis_galbana.AAC.2